MSSADKEVISVEKATVMTGRLVLDVRVASGFPSNTSPDIAEAALKVRPTLADHTCINSCGPDFGAVIDSTPLPHLFEHLIIDEQVRLARTQAQEQVHADAQLSKPMPPVLEAQSPERSRAQARSLLQGQGRQRRAERIPVFKGSTEWTDAEHRCARVQVSFADDIVALKAVIGAQALLQRIFAEHFSMLE